jgi:hypothetical protein
LVLPPKRQTSYRRPLLLVIAGALSIFSVLYFNHNYTNTNNKMSASSTLTGWHSRAIIHPEPSAFTPSENTLVVGLLRSYPAGSSLVVGIFKPDIAVDAVGQILQLTKDDWTGLVTLAKQATAETVPKAAEDFNQWRIAHPRTSLPIHQLTVTHGEGDVREVQVYGFSKDTRTLEESPDGGVTTELPEILQEIFGVLDEAPEEERQGDANTTLVNSVAEIVSFAVRVCVHHPFELRH